jgi:hypothetical protein
MINTFQELFNINMKIRQIISSIKDFTCIRESADDLHRASTPGEASIFIFSARRDLLAYRHGVFLPQSNFPILLVENVGEKVRCFFLNIGWEKVFNNSEFLVGAKTQFTLLNERSHCAADVINVSTTSSRRFRSL